jgi:hypothetical protein
MRIFIKNRQRTSTVGILKAEAVILFLKVLRKFKIE